MTVNEKLKMILKERGIKQTAVAEALGIKITTFNAMLNGTTSLKVETLIKVCDFIGMPSENFFNYEFQENGNE